MQVQSLFLLLLAHILYFFVLCLHESFAPDSKITQSAVHSLKHGGVAGRAHDSPLPHQALLDGLLLALSASADVLLSILDLKSFIIFLHAISYAHFSRVFRLLPLLLLKDNILS